MATPFSLLLLETEKIEDKYSFRLLYNNKCPKSDDDVLSLPLDLLLNISLHSHFNSQAEENNWILTLCIFGNCHLQIRFLDNFFEQFL